MQVATPLRNTLAATTAKTLRNRFSQNGGPAAEGGEAAAAGDGEEGYYGEAAIFQNRTARTASGVLRTLPRRV